MRFSVALLVALALAHAWTSAAQGLRRPDADLPATSELDNGGTSAQQLGSALRPLSDTFVATRNGQLTDGQEFASPPPGEFVGDEWARYHNHDEMVRLLQDVVNNSNGACTLDELDPPSVEGRVLYAVVASPRNPAGGAVLPRPSFTWIGNMHGDETANRELLLRLAAGLCNGELADSDARWKALQGSTTVRIIPTMNPDGYERRTRWNANKVDLNRNFWSVEYPYAKPTLDQARKRDRYGATMYPAADMWSKVGNFTLQPEAVAVSRYLAAAPPDLSANLHGGALVANYPLDACDSVGALTNCPTAEEPLPRQLAAAYAVHNPNMSAQGTAPFRAGTVQGAAWYPVLGSMQDWVYHHLDRLMLTLELHEVKDPPATALDDLWGQNSAAFLRIMELAGMGLRGRVLDQQTRAPLAATITPYRPNGGAIKYLPIQLKGLRLGVAADRVTAEGSAVTGAALRIERTLLATRAPAANKKKKMLRATM
eukprot:XP_001700144.1 predicted protein [Chlamydomonas reinhardtii]